MTNQEIENRLRALVSQERKITAEILALIREAERRRLFIARGYPSSFEWLVKEFGFSHSSAYRRIQAARLLKNNPEAIKKLETGELKLTAVAELQNAISKEERRTGTKIPVETAQSLLHNIEGKTEGVARSIIVEQFPLSAGPRDSLKSINGSESRFNIVVSDSTKQSLLRAKEVLSHVMPAADWSEIMDYVLKDFLERKDPLKKLTQQVAAPAAQRAVSPGLRAKILQRAGGRCEFVHGEKRCDSRHQVEVDHIQPRALGGGNDPSNLRALCRAHNQFEAERLLGTHSRASGAS